MLIKINREHNEKPYIIGFFSIYHNSYRGGTQSMQYCGANG